MPFITQINGATVDLSAATPLVTLPSTGLLNNISASAEFPSYNVNGAGDGTQPEAVSNGYYLAPVLDGTPLPGTYGGGVTFSNAAVTVGSVSGFLATGLSLQVNPIEGSYFFDENGNVFIITDDPLNADNLTVTGTLSLAGVQTDLLNVSLTDVIANPLVNSIVPGGVTNSLLNSVANTQIPAPGVDLVIPPGQINDIVCFAAGTMILTPQGYRLVEDLEVGDLVCTKDNGDKPLQWIGSRSLDAGTLKANPHLKAIRIRVGALGDGVPSSDLLVSPQHRVLVRSKIAIRMFDSSEVLVAAKQLLCLDGIDIADDMDTVDYFHFLFDQHEVVISNGAETESLYTGAQAIKGVGKAAAEEIFALFPELLEEDYHAHAARPLLSGRQGRKLAMRHLTNDRPLVM